MNATLETIFNRYSCRGYEDKCPSGVLLETIARAGAAAPSAMNLQPWRILLVKDRALLDEMDAEGMRILKQSNPDAYQRMAERGGKLFYNAPAMFLVLHQTGVNSAPLDGGIVTQNIALAASSLGLGNVICGMAAIPLTGEKGADFKRRLGFPEGFEFGMAILVGHPADTKAPHEPDMDKISQVG